MEGKVKRKDFVTLRSRKRASGLSSLYLDIFHNGVRKTEYLKLYLTNGSSREDKAKDKEALRAAEAIRACRVVELMDSRIGIDVKAPSEVKFFEYMQQIIDRKDGTTKTSWKNCMSHVENYEKNHDITFGDIDYKWVLGFRDHIDNASQWAIDSRKRRGNEKPLAEGTKALMFQKFCTVFNMAVRDGILLRNPADNIERFEESYAPREFLTQDELRRLVSVPAPDELVGKAFLFSCFTGMRWSDIVPLRWDDIRDMGDRHRIVFKQKKTGGLEYLDLSPQAVKVLGQRGEDDELIFDGITAVQNARINVSAWVRAAGINKHITFHCGRHTFAVMMLDLGVDLYTVSKLLGHKSIETTQIYAKVLDKNKLNAVDRIPNFI